MDADSDFKVQARFERYAEFVALQDQALSLDDASFHVSDEELGRRINLMWGIINIVCRKQPAFLLFMLIASPVCRIPRTAVFTRSIFRGISRTSGQKVQILCSRAHRRQFQSRRHRDFRFSARAGGAFNSCIVLAVQLPQVQGL